MNVRADLHCHTAHSHDGRMRPEDVVRACERSSVTCLAVTDHNQIAGAVEVARLAPFRVVLGEEIRTLSGEIIGYFLRERIPPRLSARQTVELIKAQGGLVCVPHPFDRLRGSRLREEVLHEILPDVDVLEVFNARIHLPSDRARAARFARQHGLPMSAGSDAHVDWEVGGAYVEMPDFPTPAEFLDSLRQGVLRGRPASPLVHFASVLNRIRGLRR